MLLSTGGTGRAHCNYGTTNSAMRWRARGWVSLSCGESGFDRDLDGDLKLELGMLGK
jgi:hypothetical protein